MYFSMNLYTFLCIQISENKMGDETDVNVPEIELIIRYLIVHTSKINMFKMDVRTFWSQLNGVASLATRFQTPAKSIIPVSFISKGQF